MDDRTKIAAMALQGMLANSDLLKSISKTMTSSHKLGAPEEEIRKQMLNYYAESSLAYADVLIAEATKSEDL